MTGTGMETARAGQTPCEHARNDGRELSPDGLLACARCHAPLPWPRKPAECLHNHAHAPLAGGTAKCLECGTVFTPKAT